MELMFIECYAGEVSKEDNGFRRFFYPDVESLYIAGWRVSQYQRLGTGGRDGYAAFVLTRTLLQRCIATLFFRKSLGDVSQPWD